MPQVQVGMEEVPLLANEAPAANDERPPPDSYDKYPDLVAPHFSPTPALTDIHTVYTKYGNCYQRDRFLPVSIEAKTRAQRIYYKYGLTYDSRHKCGLFIAGSEIDVMDKDRDRMMILVFELKRNELDFWKHIHFDAVELLDHLGLSGEQEVCIRYYSKPQRYESPSPDYLVVRDEDNTVVNQSGTTASRADHFAAWQAERSEAYPHAQALEQRAHRERSDRVNGNHDSAAHAVSISEAASALSTLLRFEERAARLPPTPPYSPEWMRDQGDYFSQNSNTNASAGLANIRLIIDFYNGLANPSRQVQPQEESYEPDGGAD